MSIVDSVFDFSVSRTCMEAYVRQESCQVSSGQGGDSTPALATPWRVADMVHLSKYLGPKGAESEGDCRSAHWRPRLISDMVHLLKGNGPKAELGTADVAESAEAGAAPVDPQVSVLANVIEMLTGREVVLVDPAVFVNAGEAVSPEQPVEAAVAQAASGDAPVQEGGFRYGYQETYVQIEKMTLSAEGVIKTADGEEVAFDLEVSVSRSLISSQSVDIRAGGLEDPLVVNYNGLAADILEQRFSFDLDIDGEAEEIGNGVEGDDARAAGETEECQITDSGRQRIGSDTGDPLEASSAYDDEENDRLDEKDNVFPHFKVWQKGPEGKERLVGLGRIGAGRIYLGHVDSPGHSYGQDRDFPVRFTSPGLYSHKNGMIRLMQQLKLNV